MTLESGRFAAEYLAEPRRQHWESFTDPLRNAGVPEMLYNLRPKTVYCELRQILAACGYDNKSDFKGRSALMIGAAPGFDVRIMRDLGITAIGVDLKEDVVKAGWDCGLVQPTELAVVSAVDFMLLMKQQRFPPIDFIIGRNLLIINPEEVEEIYEMASLVLKSKGVLFLTGDLPPISEVTLPNFPWNNTEVFSGQETFHAVLR